MNIQCVAVPLQQTRLHHFIVQLERDFDVAPQSYPDISAIGRSFIQSVGSFPRIPMMQHQSEYLCVGQFRLYAVFKYALDNDHEIPAIVFSRRFHRSELHAAYWAERLTLTACYQLDKNNARQLYRAWKRAHEDRLGDSASKSVSKAAFCTLFQVSRYMLEGL